MPPWGRVVHQLRPRLAFVATTTRLLISRIDVSAPGADAAIQLRASVAIVVPSMVPMVVAEIASLSVTIDPVMVARHRWGRTQVKSTPAAVPAIPEIDVSATPVTLGGMRASIATAAAVITTAAPAQHERSRRQDATTTGWWSVAGSVPVPKRGTRRVRAAPAHASVAEALVDTPH